MFTMNIKRRNPNYKTFTTQGYIITGKKIEKVTSIKRPSLNLSEAELIKVISEVLANYDAMGEPVKIKIEVGRYYVEYKTRNPLGIEFLNLGNIIITGKF